MKIATFNIQNIFHRNKSLIHSQMGKCTLEWIKEMDFLMRKILKSPKDIDRIRELSFLIGFEKTNQESYAVMRKRAGEIFLKGTGSSIENKASTLSEWNGWVPVTTLPLNPDSITNKARLIAEVDADIMLLQEIEDRGTLVEFDEKLLRSYNKAPYREVLVLQGNDFKGRELALMTKDGFKILEIQTYMEERVDGKYLFDSNLLRYKVATPFNNTFWLLAVHFINPDVGKGTAENWRFLQAARIAQIYKEMKEDGNENIIIAGTLNDASYAHSLSPLLQNTDLKDITRHPEFNVDIDTGDDAGYYRMGAYSMGVNIKQKDYMMLSPEIFALVKKGGINRKAIWPDKPGKWKVYNTLNSKEQQASEHPIIWCEIEI